MKPHLPAYLFQALLATCVAVLTTNFPVFADIPWNYRQVDITDAGQLASYTKSDYIAFIISTDIMDSAYGMTGAHQYWTDDALHTHVLTFEEIESTSNGGALSISSALVVEHLQELSFFQNVSGSTYRLSGGAIYGDYTSVITLSDNDSVTFNGNTSSYDGGAIAASGSLNLTNNGSVTFCENHASDGAGGAIFVGKNNSCSAIISGNDSVTFSGNTAYYSGGGAIYASNTLTLSENGSVTFSGNTASSGGAIDAVNSTSVITLRDNGSVTFSGNTAASYGGAIYAQGTLNLAGNETVTFSENNTSYYAGGAIYAKGTLNLTGNGIVTFSKNTSPSSGGAIYGDSSSVITLRDNGSVTFSENTASNHGGAIDAQGTLNLVGNKTVTFNGNTSSYDGGAISASTFNLTDNGNVTFSGNNVGAIYGNSGSVITLSDNGSVTFNGNTSYRPGGAIHGDIKSTLNLTGNRIVTFSQNTSSSSGGAIYGNSDSVITLSDNDSVTFSGNTAYHSGGAIYASDTLNLTGNGTVTFSENFTTDESEPKGGAICASDTRSVSFTGNDAVTFRGNYEKKGSDDSATYRLRSVAIFGSTLTLAAGEGQDITFYDTLYAYTSSKVSFNAKYVDKDGVTRNAMGDIVFSGAHAEEDLRKLKPNFKPQELMDSLTTEVYVTTNLYGGRLCIEDGAIYRGRGINVAANSTASLRLAGGALDQAGYNVVLNAGTTLDLIGANSITVATLDMKDGSTMTFTLGETNLSTAALTLTGTFNQGGSLAINLADGDSVEAYEKYALITMSSGTTPATWDTSRIAVSGLHATVSDLSWESGTLYLTVPLQPLPITWTGYESSVWDTSSLNWESNGSASTYKDSVDVVFGDTGAGMVTLTGELAPESVLVENGAEHDYSFAGEGSLVGATALTKRGEGKLTIATANTYTGGAVVEGGTLVVGNSAALGTGSVAMRAGVLDLGGNTIANNVTTQGEVSIANGGIAGNVSMSDTMLEIEHDVTISGKITASSENLIAVDAGATLSISQTIANTGSYLEIAGAVDVSNIAGTKVGESSYIGGAVLGNGFEQSNMRIQVISDSKTSRHDISEASFIYKGAEVELDSTCAFNVGETDYTAFYVNSGTESLGTALDGAESAQVELAGVVMKSGTELAVDRNANTDLIQVKSGKATINIAEGVTLSETNATRTDFILQGAGQYQLASGSTSLGATLGENWKGAVQLVDVAVFEDFDLNQYGKAGSVVRMDGASVKLAPSNNVPFLPTLELTGDGMTITGCYAGETYIFAGGVIGDGDFVYNPTSLQHKQTYIFTGDVSQWTGAYESKANKTSTLKFYGDAAEMGAAILQTAGTVNVEVGNGEDDFATIFDKEVNVSSLKVMDKAAATLAAASTVTGSIEVDGSLMIGGEGQLHLGSAATIQAVGASATATITGADISSALLRANGKEKAELSGVSIATAASFTIEDVKLAGSLIDVGEDTMLTLRGVEISADSRITDATASVFLEGTEAFLTASNTDVSEVSVGLKDITFYRAGDTETWMTLPHDVSLVSLSSELFTRLTLTGTDLWLDLTDLADEVGAATVFSISFTDGALFDVDNLRVYATLNGVDYLDGYTTQQSGTATTLYFSEQIPEPTTSTLSLLALSALAGRRKKQ